MSSGRTDSAQARDSRSDLAQGSLCGSGVGLDSRWMIDRVRAGIVRLQLPHRQREQGRPSVGEPEPGNSDRGKDLRLGDEVERLLFLRIPLTLQMQTAFAGGFAGNGFDNFLCKAGRFC